MRDYFPGVTTLTQRVNTELALPGYYSAPPAAIDTMPTTQRPLPALSEEIYTPQAAESKPEPYSGLEGQSIILRTNPELALRAMQPLPDETGYSFEPIHVVSAEARHMRPRKRLARDVLRRCARTVNIRKSHNPELI